MYCLAGADLPADDRRIARWLAARGWTRTDVVRNDTFAVLRAGTDRTWGVAVVCGYGTNCSAVAPDGRTFRFPAVGDISGDWGGGHDIGSKALWYALRAQDGRGERTALERVVPEHFGLRRPRQVMEAMYFGRLPSERVVELPPVVFRAAGDGDAVARSIVDRQADEVVAMAGAAIRKLRMTALDVDVVLGGGIFRNEDAGFHARIEEGLRAVAPDVRIRRLTAPPILGAALLGLDRLGASRAAKGAASEHAHARPHGTGGLAFDPPDGAEYADTAHGRPRGGPAPRPAAGGGDEMARIVLDRITRTFGSEVTAVDDVSLEIEDGEFMVLVGPSGCGKTTILRIVAGLEEVTAGEVIVGDRQVTDLPPKDRDMAMVFQNYALYPHMTVEQNLGFGLKLRGAKKDEIKRRVHGGRAHAVPRAAAAAEAGGAVGRPAPARGHGPGDGPRARRVPDGRAAVEPGREAPRGDAGGAGPAPRPPQDHDAVRHARPGRGDDARRPRRRPEGRSPAAGRHAAAAVQRAGEPVRRGVHRLAVDEPGGRARRGRRRALRPVLDPAAAGPAAERVRGQAAGARDPAARLRGRGRVAERPADHRGEAPT